MTAVKRIVCVVCWLLVPASAFAQATLAGVVKDPSGAVLPGVTVEATSPALIEKSRSAVTDGTGQYRLTELPPGTYSLTFTLSGFSTIKREAVDVSGAGVMCCSTSRTPGMFSAATRIACRSSSG